MSLQLHVHHLWTNSGSLLHGLQLEVAAGQIHTVMGPSGSGKSSLLAAVCGTLAPGIRFEGSVALQGRRVDQLPTEQRRIGILYQDDYLFPHMTVAENLLFALPAGPPAARQARVVQGLKDLEMPDYANADPSTLSGGQRSRVALMRALLADPQALLLDEPFSRLDVELRTRVREFVYALVRKRRIPVLMVTHDDADIADPAHLTRLGVPGPRHV